MSMLQELLNIGLVEIGSDDSRFEKMQSAASSLATRFGEEPGLLIPATLIALDEDVDENAPFFTLVEDMVTEEWKTLRNTHSNRPRQLLRSIAVDALATTSAASAEVSGVIWNTAASLLRHKQIRLGKAAGLIEQLLVQACDLAETEAIKRAGMSPPPTKRRTKKKSSSSPASPTELNLDATIEDKEILQDVARSAGPQSVGGEALPEPNPHWTNQAQTWSHEFTPRMTAAMVKAVNLGTSRLAESIANDLAAHVTSLEKNLLDQLNAAEKLQIDMAQSNAAGRMRLDVLWWSEARYSPSLKKGYAELNPLIAALVAAVDLTAIVPALAPASVTYVLAETVASICRDCESRPLEDYLKSLAKDPQGIGDRLPRAAANEIRVPLVELVAGAASGADASADIVRSRTGIGSDLELAPAEFAMWIFREIQAHRMVQELA